MGRMVERRDNPVWDQEGLRDPHGAPDKAKRVRGMFGAIVNSYDLNNRLHSLWLDQHWRRHAARLAEVRPGDTVLDVGCGTGDLALACAARGPKRVMGVDFCPPMLVAAQRKVRRAALDVPISVVVGDAMALPVPDASVDVLTIAFGIRNVVEPRRALSEFARVLGPGGRLAILEFSMPRGRIAGRLYHYYFTKLMPPLATLISGDRTGAYKYLPKSVVSFMGREELLAGMGEVGFRDTRAIPLTLGVAVVYLGAKPGPYPGVGPAQEAPVRSDRP